MHLGHVISDVSCAHQGFGSLTHSLNYLFIKEIK